jgi:hypothetical protein
LIQILFGPVAIVPQPVTPRIEVADRISELTAVIIRKASIIQKMFPVPYLVLHLIDFFPDPVHVVSGPVIAVKKGIDGGRTDSLVAEPPQAGVKGVVKLTVVSQSLGAALAISLVVDGDPVL